jgi:hypothetical protein
MLDRDVGLAPPSRRTPLVRQPLAKLGLSASARSTKCHRRADVLVEIGQREGGIGKDARIVAGYLQGSLG